MEFNIYILILILSIIIISMIILFILYLLLPSIFNQFISPKFNSTYIYDSKDFKKKGILHEHSTQEKNAQIDINMSQGTYRIMFGAERELIEGIIRIRYNANEYINHNNSQLHKKVLELLTINKGDGDDKLGVFKSIDAQYTLEGKDIYINTSIKQYNKQDFIIFELSLPQGLENTSSGKYSDLISSFPSFINKSPNTKIFTFRNAKFCPPSKTIGTTSAPVLFYDDDLNCFIISPLDGFLHTVISKDKNNRINCGIQGAIKKIPEDFTQKFILLFGKGINKSMERLGDILLKYHDSKRKSLYANVVTSYLGFWTDCGAYYYYRKEKGMNYEDTMVVIKDYFDEHKIPIGYYNFDSWWYLKHTNKTFATIFKPLIRIMGGGLFGNTLRWEVDPKNFSTDLKTFHQEQFKKPITAHSRRWDARSPYVEKFEFETYENHAVPLKKEFWDWLMNHAKESGIEVYEQDWMKNQIVSMPILKKNFNAQEEWLNNMASAAKENGIDIFYCMQTPGILLYSLKHSNVNIARCSHDYNHMRPLTFRFIPSTQTNILFHAIGINSHPDVFRSRTMENVKFRIFDERFPDFKCLYQILNAGLVAPGDKKEDVNWTLLQKTCRNDGLLLKPDKALTVNDLMFKKHRKYYICDTYSKIDNLTWRYVLISNIWPKRVKETSFTLKELGFDSNEYILYDYLSGGVNRIKFDDYIEIGRLRKHGYKYFILCPVTESDMALIGCPDKFITCSKKMFIGIETTKNSISFLVENIKEAIVKILIYSENPPYSIQVDKELFNLWNYNESLNLIELNLKFEKLCKKEV
ncbi:MAG: hypothetical protein ACFFDN_41115, partial [Candidatus Hodarchaeota archaeon]